MNESPLLVLDGADVSSLLSHFSPSFRRRWQPLLRIPVKVMRWSPPATQIGFYEP
jgi:hypothetical protein